MGEFQKHGKIFSLFDWIPIDLHNFSQYELRGVLKNKCGLQMEMVHSSHDMA